MRELLPKLLSFSVTVAVAIGPAVACSQERMLSVEASDCYLVDPSQDDSLLLGLLDDVAAEHGLSPEKSHPLNPRWILRGSNGVAVAEISARFLMGPCGTVLSVYHYLEPEPVLVAALSDAKHRLKANELVLQRCADVEGFEAPVMFIPLAAPN